MDGKRGADGLAGERSLYNDKQETSVAQNNN